MGELAKRACLLSTATMDEPSSIKVAPSPWANMLGYCPTQSGTVSGFRPEWRPRESEEWREIPYDISYLQASGIPFPALSGGVLRQIGLCGEFQAKALAYTFAAEKEARIESCEVRVVELKVEYQIRAKEVDGSHTPDQKPSAKLP